MVLNQTGNKPFFLQYYMKNEKTVAELIDRSKKENGTEVVKIYMDYDTFNLNISYDNGLFGEKNEVKYWDILNIRATDDIKSLLIKIDEQLIITYGQINEELREKPRKITIQLENGAKIDWAKDKLTLKVMGINRFSKIKIVSILKDYGVIMPLLIIPGLCEVTIYCKQLKEKWNFEWDNRKSVRVLFNKPDVQERVKKSKEVIKQIAGIDLKTENMRFYSNDDKILLEEDKPLKEYMTSRGVVYLHLNMYNVISIYSCYKQTKILIPMDGDEKIASIKKELKYANFKYLRK